MVNSNDSRLKYFLLIKELRQLFPFNEETDCREKYNEIIQDYLHEKIISQL